MPESFVPARQPLSVTLLLVVVVLVLMGAEQLLIQMPIVANPNQGVLGTLIGDFVGRSALADIASLGLLFGVSLYTIKITVGKMVLGVRCYLSALFYVLFVAVVAAQNVTFETALTALIFAKSSSLFIQSYRRSNLSYDYVFRAGFMLGLMPLLFGQMLVLFPMVITACIAFRRSAKEYMLAIVGYLMPILICSYLYWAFGYEFSYVAKNIIGSFSTITTEVFTRLLGIPLERLVFVGIYLWLAIFAFVSFLRTGDKLRNSTMRMFSLFVVVALLTLIMMILPHEDSTAVVIAAMPLSIVVPAFFTTFSARFTTICYTIVLLSGFGVVIWSLLTL